MVFAASSYLATIGVAYFNSLRRMQIFTNGALMSWILAHSLIFIWVFARPEPAARLAYRALQIHGYFPLVFWAIPFFCFIGALVTAALGVYTVAYFTGHVKSA